MDITTRPHAPNPYDLLPEVPTFNLSSSCGAHGDTMPGILTADGGSHSPDLSWSGFPEGTQSFMLTCFDPDAPTPSGYWHWCVVDLPATVTSLAANAGDGDESLPSGSFHIKNDAGVWAYYGAAPPEGDYPHRYIFSVHALDVPSVGCDREVSPATASFMALFHTIARATLTLNFANSGQLRTRS